MNRRTARFTQPVLTVFVIAGCLLLLVACGSNRPELTPEHPYWKDNDTKDIPEPAHREPSLVWQTIQRSTFEQADQLLDLDRSFRKVFGNPREAWNINSVDEVPNSAWYTNRHHLKPMTAGELRRGAVHVGGPDKTGPWTVFRPKVGGVTAGFWIEDIRGNQYILKFDPPGNPEMATAAAAISGRVLYACGYSVPEETITEFHPEELVIKDGVTYKDDNGERQPFTREKLYEILELAHQNEDGTIRCLASLALPDIKGPFSWDGRRDDDPNDWCPHEHRRELRALYVVCSFLNHWDIKDENTMDTYADENGRRYLKHHLLDFGSTLGSAGWRAQLPTSGYTNQVDLLDAAVSYGTLGLKKWQWEDAEPYQYPSIGYFEAEIFHPAKWDPIYPIPAFENRTSRDSYWGAKLVMALRDDDLRALVDAGQLSNPEAREYLFSTLRERRDKIGRHWFSKINPLDHFVAKETPRGTEILFRDLGLEYGLHESSLSFYDLTYRGRTLAQDTLIAETSLLIKPALKDKIASMYRPGGEAEDHLVKIEIRTDRNRRGLGPPVIAWLWYHEDTAELQLVGVEHCD
ncbi:hypothetical protein GF377_08530 [candidate division GN15 bacterium]|nr:hypothetical protein [candidate division GN15 bacterium]